MFGLTMCWPHALIFQRVGGIFHNLGSLKIFKIYMVYTQNRKCNITIVKFSVRLLLWKIGNFTPSTHTHNHLLISRKIILRIHQIFSLIIIVDDRNFFSPPTKNRNGIPNVKLICFLNIKCAQAVSLSLRGPAASI